MSVFRRGRTSASSEYVDRPHNSRETTCCGLACAVHVAGCSRAMSGRLARFDQRRSSAYSCPAIELILFARLRCASCESGSDVTHVEIDQARQSMQRHLTPTPALGVPAGGRAVPSPASPSLGRHACVFHHAPAQRALPRREPRFRGRFLSPATTVEMSDVSARASSSDRLTRSCWFAAGGSLAQQPAPRSATLSTAMFSLSSASTRVIDSFLFLAVLTAAGGRSFAARRLPRRQVLFAVKVPVVARSTVVARAFPRNLGMHLYKCSRDAVLRAQWKGGNLRRDAAGLPMRAATTRGACRTLAQERR